jgi:hypothetical protein
MPDDELDLNCDFTEGDWPAVLAYVARRAEEDGLRLQVYRDPDDGQRRVKLTHKEKGSQPK